LLSVLTEQVEQFLAPAHGEGWDDDIAAIMIRAVNDFTELA